MANVPSAPKSSNRTAIIAVIIAVVVVVGIVAISIGMSVTAKNNVKDNGVTTVGTPTGNVINFRDSGTRHNSDNWRVEYSFVVDGESYLAYGESSDHIRKDAQNRADQIGDVTVYYLPEDPSKFYVYDYGNFF